MIDTLNTQLLTAWSELAPQDNSINVSPSPPPGSSKILTIVSWGGWIAMIMAVLGIMIAGGKFAWEKQHHGASNQSAMAVGWACAGCVCISIAGGLVGALVG